jgi:hypothetical protein
MKAIENMLLVGEPVVINIGLKEFYQALLDQMVKVVHVEWFPPAASDQDLIDLLDQLL